MFDEMKARFNCAKPLNVFLFGGAEGVAAAACQAINAQHCGVHCVGSLYPGFGSVDELSRDGIINTVNSSDADFLIAALGAHKGQLWLQQNHHRVRIPVRAHLGAVMNFQAGTVRRAPVVMRKCGLEWLWRIMEEPYLWGRYWNDGLALLRLLITRVLPLVLRMWWLRQRCGRSGTELVVEQSQDHKSVTVKLVGPATAPHIHKIISAFEEAMAANKQIMVDLSDTSVVDTRFMGLLLMLAKKVKSSDAMPRFLIASPRLEAILRLNGLQYLLLTRQS